LSFFDSLTSQVARRIEARKQDTQSQRREKDLLVDRLRVADTQTRPALEKELSNLLASMQSSISSLDLRNYIEDFEAVLLNPGQYLRLDQLPINMDSMGIRRKSDDADPEEAIIFNELIGFDRRDWTVTMVYCSNIPFETFASKLEKAYRELAI
jgi:hypothetical protein